MAWDNELKQQAIDLAVSTTAANAAEVTGVPAGTIRRWLSDQGLVNGALRNERSKTSAEGAQKNERSKSERSKVRTTYERERREEVAAKVPRAAVKVPETVPKVAAKITAEIEEEQTPGLTEMQRLFCLYYVKSFNATMAAIKAGYAKSGAHVEGHRMLRNPKIAAEIKRLKGSMTGELFISAMDVLNKYAQIAFADITDFIEYGQRKVPVMTMFGPAKDEEGKILEKDVNYVDFKPSSDIDGTIIQEVKQGKEGIAIKLSDKMKALEKLERYFDLLPDHHKRRLEEERLKLDREKLAIEKAKADDPEDTGDDGFMEALEGKVNEAWDDYEDDTENSDNENSGHNNGDGDA